MGFFLIFALLGAGLGAVYDVLAALRIHLGLKKRGEALLDGLFCAAGLCAFLLTMMRHTDGRLRAYLWLGLLGGFWLYKRTLSRWMRKMLSAFRK